MAENVRPTMRLEDLLVVHDEVCGEAKAIMETKNHDYTSGSKDPFSNFRASEVLGVAAEKGILIRVVDKLQRIRSFIEQGSLAVKTEPVDDAISDVVNYMVLLQGMIEERRMQECSTTQTESKPSPS